MTARELLFLRFPAIEEALVHAFRTLRSDYEACLESKSKVPPNQAVTALFAKFPHSYSTYTKAVDMFVDVAKNAPDDAIAVLFDLLPATPPGRLNAQIRQTMTDYDSQAGLYDLILVLFFADCVAQVLTANPETQHTDRLLELGYSMIKPFQNAYELGLRLSIAKQFSVILSLLSIHHLGTVLRNVMSVFEESDQTLFFVLHRFIRLSASRSISVREIGDFLTAFTDLSKHLKKEETLDHWARAMTSLVLQLNSDDSPELSQFLPNVFHLAYKKAHGKSVHAHYLALCSAVIMRETTINKTSYDSFLKNDILKRAKNPKLLEETLNAFLVIIRGKFCSRTTQFWEWGSYNALAHYGVEASHLFNPEQDQSDPQSFTSLFFKYFVGMPIEHYPTVTGKILINFAARDFLYFIQTTIPSFIEKLGHERSLIPLLHCLEFLIDPQMHFAEWAQTNPRNVSTVIAREIPVLFMQMKPLFFGAMKKSLSKSLTNTGYCFTMVDSSTFPVFSLPFTMESTSGNARRRIGKSTLKVGQKLGLWGFKESPTFGNPVAEMTTIESVSEEEERQIKLLSLLPRMVNTSDLVANDFGTDLLSMALVESSALGVWAVRIINQIFVTLEDSRILFYEKLVEVLSKCTEEAHVFIHLQLLVKLMDLSLSLSCANDERIRDFIDNAQAMALYLFTFDSTEIRDFLILFIERLHQLGSSFGMGVFMYTILTSQSVPIASAVRYRAMSFKSDDAVPGAKLPEGLITLREAASSKYHFIFRFFLCEIASLLQRAKMPLLIKAQKLILERLPSLPDVNSPEFRAYGNLFAVLMHLFPIIDDAEIQAINETPFASKTVQFYEMPVLREVSPKHVEVLKANSEKATAKANEVLQTISSDVAASDSHKKLVEILHFMSWSMAVWFLPIFSTWFEERIAQKGPTLPIEILNAAGEILIGISQIPDFSLTLAASACGKDVFLKYFRICEDFFEEQGLCNYAKCGTSSDSGQVKQDLAPAMHYCVVFANFTRALTVDYVQPKSGAPRCYPEDKWLKTGVWPISRRQKQFTGLFNWSLLCNRRDPESESLGSKAKLAIHALVCYASLFDNTFHMTPPMEQLFVKMEQEGLPVLTLLLAHHHDMFQSFLKSAFEAAPAVSQLYFRAICLQTFKGVDDNRLELLPSKKQRMLVSSLSQVKLVHCASYREIQHSVPFLRTQLTPEEVDFVQKLVENSPKLFVVSLLYLLSDEYSIRCHSFKFIHRLCPVIRSILYPDSPRDTAKMVAEIQRFAPTFYSTFMTISPHHVIGICRILANYFPVVSDSMICEVLKTLSIPDQSSFVASKRPLLIQFVTPFLSNERLCDENPKLSWQKGFALYTSYSLLEALLNVLPYIGCSAMNEYLAMWSEMADSGKGINYLINFLLYSDAAMKVANDLSLKTVLLHLAGTYSDQVINALTAKLTFGCWFNTSLQGHLDVNVPPVVDQIPSIGFVLITLTELAQRHMDLLLPKLPIILNFALLFYDREPALMSDLLLVLLAYLPRCPDSLCQVFLPPASLLWSKEIAEDTETDREVTETDIVLRPYKKPPMSVLSFVRQFSAFLRKTHKKQILQEWGKELLRWICGCGDLVIAARAALIYAEIMRPMSDLILQYITQSLFLVCSSGQNELASFYTRACFRVFSAAIDKYYAQEAFMDSFKLVFRVAAAFLSVPEESELCDSALSLVAKFILYSPCDSDDLRRLLQRLSILLACLRPRRTLHAAFLAIFMREAKNASMNISKVAFILFLPTIYTAFAAYYNMQPFSAVMNDTDIPLILESAILMTTTTAVPEEIRDSLHRTLQAPASQMPDDFMLQACASLSALSPEVVTEAATYLVMAAKNAYEELLRAIFLVVACFVEATTVTQEHLAAFAPVARLAAVNMSPQATRLIQAFVGRNAQEVSSVESDLAVEASQSGWNEVVRKLEHVSQSIDTMEIPSEPTEMKAPIFMVPLEQGMWRSQAIREVREKMKDVTVTPFTENRRMMETAEEEILLTERARSDVVIPLSDKAYLEYLHFLREVERDEGNGDGEK